jgi:hypothetical protein
MAAVFKRALKLLIGTDPSSRDLMYAKKSRPLNKLTERELLQLESEIGAEIFGELPKGRRRAFFNLDPTTWIWHEEWLDEKGALQQATTRYEVHEKGILKVQEGARYDFLEGQELENLTLAAQMYYERVMREIYKRDPQTGQNLS